MDALCIAMKADSSYNGRKKCYIYQHTFDDDATSAHVQ